MERVLLWLFAVLNFNHYHNFILNQASKKQFFSERFIDRGFHHIGEIQKLNKISAQEMIDYMEKEFKKGGFTFKKDIFENVLLYTDNIPYYNQYLASQIWQLAKDLEKSIDEELIERAVNQILDNQSDYYYTLFDQLTTYQRSVLHAFLLEQENIYSKEYTQKYGLSSVFSTQRAMMRLIELEIIDKIEDKYVFSDPFFPRHLRLRTFA